MTEYDGGLGTTVTVTASDSTTNTGFNTTVALVGPSTSGTASANIPKRIASRSGAEDLFGSDSAIADAYDVATSNGNDDLVGVGVDTSSSGYTEAVKSVADQARYIVPLTAETSDISAAVTGAREVADDLTFTRIIAPGGDTDPSSATTPETDERLVVVSPTNITVDGTQSFTAVAVAAVAARQNLGESITYDEVEFDGFSKEYRRSVAQDFADGDGATNDGPITAVTRDGVIADGVTTAEEEAFRDIYAVEIVDAVTAALDTLGQEFAGNRPNTPGERRSLESAVDGLLSPLTQGRPPLLSTVNGEPAFERSATAVTKKKVRLNVAISPVDVMKQIDIVLDVGSIVTPVAVQV